MAKQELGTKRTCLECDKRYYDLNKDPIICPYCDSEFVVHLPEVVQPTVGAVVDKDDSTDMGDDSAVFISLEDADDEASETGEIDSTDDIEIDNDDDTFLDVEDDDDTDVSGIIGSDLRDDEE